MSAEAGEAFVAGYSVRRQPKAVQSALLVLEEVAPDGTLRDAEGAWEHWNRSVTIRPTHDDDRVELTERVDFTPAIPVFGPAFALLIASSLRKGPLRHGKVPMRPVSRLPDIKLIAVVHAVIMVHILRTNESIRLARPLTEWVEAPRRPAALQLNPIFKQDFLLPCLC